MSAEPPMDDPATTVRGDPVTVALVVSSAAATLAFLALRPSVGVGLGLGLEILALTVWFALLCVASRSPSRAPSRSLVWASGLTLLGVAVAKRPFGSQDLWSYVMQGRMIVVHHASPYLHRPAEYPADPFTSFVPVGWRTFRSPYGPLFSVVSAGGSLIAGGSVVANRLVHQGLAGACLVASARLHERRGRPLAVPFLVMNPMCIAIVNGGHNDLLVGGFIVCAIDAAVGANGRRWRGVICGALLAAAALIKLTAVLPALAVFIWLVRRFGRRVGLIAATTSVALCTVAYYVAGGLRALRPVLAAGGSRVSRASAAGVVNRAFGHETIATRLTIVMVAVGILLALAVASTSRLRSSPTPTTTGTILTMLAVAPFVLPWYAGWMLPAAAESTRSNATRAATLWSAALFLAYTEPPGRSTGAISTVLAVLPPACALGLAGSLALQTIRPSNHQTIRRS